MIYLFIVGMIIYGLARATQQACIFMERNNEPRWHWLANPNQIHFYGWFEPIGLFIAVYVVGKYNPVWLPVFMFSAYFVYWLPYALLYCHLRRKEWFNHNQMYAVGWVKTYLLNKPVSIILFFIAIVSLIALDYICKTC